MNVIDTFAMYLGYFTIGFGFGYGAASFLKQMTKND